MEKLFWECFNNTGRLDMYLLYKDFKQEQEAQNPKENEYKQSFLTRLEGEEHLL